MAAPSQSRPDPEKTPASTSNTTEHQPQPAHPPHAVETPRHSLHTDASASEADSHHDRDEEKAIPGSTTDPVSAEFAFDPIGGSAVLQGPAGAASPTLSRRSRSRASSTRSRALTIVPRSERRGLFGRFTLVPEVERPFDYSNSTKWGITATIAAASAATPMGSSIFYPALPIMTKELHTTETIINLSVAMYMLSMSIFPIWWSAFSEHFGRRSIYLISFSIYVVSAILCGLSTNVSMLIVFRICGGGASASVQAVGAGTIADVWEPRERGRAMSMFYLGPLVGPLIAPILGGVLSQKLGWQSTMYFLAIYGFGALLLLFFLLPETLAKRAQDEPSAAASQELRRMTTTESAKVHTKKFAAGVKKFLFDPLKVLLMLRFPPVLITVFTAAIAFGALFVVNISVQQKFSKPPYNFEQIIVGLLYIPAGLGYFTGSFIGGRWVDNIMAREAKKANRYDEEGRLVYLPEDRMRENMWLANTMYPLSLLWYGWSLKYKAHFMVPAVSLYFFGFASMLVFSAVTTMLTEFVRKKSSSGVALNNFVRNILSCVGTIVAASWINAIDVGWVFTIICIFCLVSGCAGVFVLKRNAPRWRKVMDEALNDQ